MQSSNIQLWMKSENGSNVHLCDLHLKTLSIMLDYNRKRDVHIQPILYLKKLSLHISKGKLHFVSNMWGFYEVAESDLAF